MITKDVVGYEGSYTVREDGYIYSLKRRHCRGGVVREWIGKVGYPIVYLCRGHKAKTVKVHRILAMAFIPNPDNKPQVNHKDGDKLNYSLTNLEWVTGKENIIHAHKIGLTIHKRGHEALDTKLNTSQRDEIAKLYACQNISQVELAKMFNVSQSLISIALKEFMRRCISGLAINQTVQT